MNSRWLIVILLIMAVAILGCSGKHLNVKKDNSLELSGCLLLPNCVSSSSWVPYTWVTPFELAMPAEEAWPKIKEVVENIPRTEIVEENSVYIHAKCRSLVFRFVDNLELLLHSEQGIISVRSSSVIALFDLGVNHWRVYKLRKQLAELGIIKE